MSDVLPASTPSGDPIVYLVGSPQEHSKGRVSTLCNECAQKELDKNPGVKVDSFVHYFGHAEICEGCNKWIASSNGMLPGDGDED